MWFHKKNKEVQPVRTLELAHPSIDLAYDLAVKSYDWILKRADVWDGSLDKILAWGTTINAGIVALIVSLFDKQGTKLQFTCLFWCGAGIFGLCVIVGLIGHLKGVIIIPDPRKTDDAWTTISTKEFKFYFIRNAGVHFQKNSEFILNKSRFVAAMTFGFIVSAALFVAWAMKLSS